MLRRTIVAMVFVAVAALVIRSLPDVARYLKIREM